MSGKRSRDKGLACLLLLAFCACQTHREANPGKQPPYLKVQWTNGIAAITYKLDAHSKTRWEEGPRFCWTEPGHEEVCIGGGAIRVEHVR